MNRQQRLDFLTGPTADKDRERARRRQRLQRKLATRQTQTTQRRPQ